MFLVEPRPIRVILTNDKIQIYLFLLHMNIFHFSLFWRDTRNFIFMDVVSEIIHRRNISRKYINWFEYVCYFNVFLRVILSCLYFDMKDMIVCINFFIFMYIFIGGQIQEIVNIFVVSIKYFWSMYKSYKVAKESSLIKLEKMPLFDKNLIKVIESYLPLRITGYSWRREFDLLVKRHGSIEKAKEEILEQIQILNTYSYMRYYTIAGIASLLIEIRGILNHKDFHKKLTGYQLSLIV